VRADDVSVALVVHVLGAMILVGGLVTAASASVVGWRSDSAALRRFSAMTLLAVALPGWIVMRVGAEWVYSEEGLDALTEDPTWLGIGFLTADLGGLLLLIALVVGGLAMRRDRQGRGGTLHRVSGALAVVLVALYVVAVWAMGGKPT
jgi:hypothetical protein